MNVSLGFVYDLDDKTVAQRLNYIQTTYGGLIQELNDNVEF